MIYINPRFKLEMQWVLMKQRIRDLNTVMQQLLNPPDAIKPEIKYGNLIK
ncbi:hypothetical protein [Pseudanabaena yagii]|uniref:Uncharacterized protein n=1 Tax=Pseudanabaena yagii GIHE-NHR1 TaxID=2722753 RepID=A0ABX1M1S7_9CYAN|nr:hypothetical protein [Pseudanabaena yagii]NMF61140.1 hypothetical protein [Pseudanabaena yagii GIHE-NHR1]